VTSERKIAANRANARASTGPQTIRGRARAARNALRHALSLPVCSIPALSKEVEALARKIAGPAANAEILNLARQIAEPQIDHLRARCARHQFLSRALADPDYDTQANKRKTGAVLLGLLRQDILMAADFLESVETSRPEGLDKFAIIISEEAKYLEAIDRYERRALSRRKFAIRAFDAARQQYNCSD
jgi:hypothetical protein